MSPGLAFHSMCTSVTSPRHRLNTHEDQDVFTMYVNIALQCGHSGKKCPWCVRMNTSLWRQLLKLSQTVIKMYIPRDRGSRKFRKAYATRGDTHCTLHLAPGEQ